MTRRRQAHNDIPYDVEGGQFRAVLNERLRTLAEGIDRAAGAQDSTASVAAGLILTVPATLSIRSQAAPLVKTESAQPVRKIEALLKQAPTGGDVVLAINAPGLLTTITIPVGSTAVAVSGSWTIPANTIVSIDITAVGLTFPGADLTVTMRF